MLLIVGLVGRRQDQPHAEPARDLDRLDRTLAFREAPQEQQVILRPLAEREPGRIDPVQHRADHVEPGQEPRLLI